MTRDRMAAALAALDAAHRDLVDALRAEMIPPEPSDLVSIPEAARLMSCSRTLIYSLIDSGALASRKVGRRRLIPRDALATFAAER